MSDVKVEKTNASRVSQAAPRGNQEVEEVKPKAPDLDMGFNSHDLTSISFARWWTEVTGRLASLIWWELTMIANAHIASSYKGRVNRAAAMLKRVSPFSVPDVGDDPQAELPDEEDGAADQIQEGGEGVYA
jgi:hypothetical protein